MDAVFLARLQFAFTIGFHYIFPPLSIGMAWLIFIYQFLFIRKKDEEYNIISQFWIKLFTITFVVGVATGITMEFQFGTNWANYSRFVGDIFGAPLAAEGVFSFFLESTFLGVLLYGSKKVSKKMYCFSSFLVAFGATLSAFWIIVANSWQQTPRGFIIEGGKAVLTDFWAAVFNPSTVPRYLHAVNGAVITGSFFVLGICAYFLLKNRHVHFAKKSMKVALIVAVLASVAQLPIGHMHAVQVAQNQPAKLAAYEGLWETRDHAPLLIFGVPNVHEEKMDFTIEIPNILSYLVGGTSDTIVTGLKDIPKDERPPIMVPFVSFHLMIAMGTFFIFLSILALIMGKKVYTNRLILKTFFFIIPIPFIANQLGWIATEVGRQPWIVYNILKTSDGVSMTLSAPEILFSLVLFGAIYALLFFVWVFLLRQKVLEGPKEFNSSTQGGY